jgi:hypothetical protein
MVKKGTIVTWEEDGLFHFHLCSTSSDDFPTELQADMYTLRWQYSIYIQYTYIYIYMCFKTPIQGDHSHIWWMFQFLCVSSILVHIHICWIHASVSPLPCSCWEPGSRLVGPKEMFGSLVSGACYESLIWVNLGWIVWYFSRLRYTGMYVVIYSIVIRMQGI